MFEYAPKIDGAPVQLEFTGQCFDRYYRKRPGWEKAPAQIESAKLVKEIGGTCYWFDAAWFPVGFPNGVGNWYSDPNNFPNGVEELGDALEKLGMKFVLWFEPERVAPGTEIATKYPQYVFGGEKGGLYKLNDPEARKFLTELLLRRIREFKVGVFRTDFNIDPLPFWRDADAPDRVAHRLRRVGGDRADLPAPRGGEPPDAGDFRLDDGVARRGRRVEDAGGVHGKPGGIRSRRRRPGRRSARRATGATRRARGS